MELRIIQVLIAHKMLKLFSIIGLTMSISVLIDRPWEMIYYPIALLCGYHITK